LFCVTGGVFFFIIWRQSAQKTSQSSFLSYKPTHKKILFRKWFIG
jgi:hypothetical protein